MSLRLRVTLASAAAMLVMVVVSSVALYVGVRRYLYHRADVSLKRGPQPSPGTGAPADRTRAIESGRLKGARHDQAPIGGPSSSSTPRAGWSLTSPPPPFPSPISCA